MKTITVQGISVEITTPYEAGHAITEAEAKALNQVRAENIRNNKAKEVKNLIEEAGSAEAAQAKAQEIVAEYDKSYEFTLASVGGGRVSDPLEKEARSIARDYVAGKIKELGMTQKEYLAKNGEDAIKNKIEEIVDHPDVQKMAKKRLAERQKMAESLSEIAA